MKEQGKELKEMLKENILHSYLGIKCWVYTLYIQENKKAEKRVIVGLIISLSTIERPEI